MDSNFWNTRRVTISWFRSAAAADLKGSTKLNFNKYAQTSAQLYEAVTGNMVRIVSAFQPKFGDLSTTAAIYGHYDLSDLERAMDAFARVRRDREEPAD